MKSMLYGERLKMGMTRRGDMLGRNVSRKEIAAVAGCSVQNIGMILKNSNGEDQTLTTKSHLDVAAYLKVSQQWLLEGKGDINLPQSMQAPKELSPAAIEMAELYDMIPLSDRIRRAQAFNAATNAILRVLSELPLGASTHPALPNLPITLLVSSSIA